MEPLTHSQIHPDFKSKLAKESVMKALILSLGFCLSLFSTSAQSLTMLLKESEIAEQLCLRNICLNNWSEVIAKTCAMRTGREAAGTDYAFGPFLNPKQCWCPCNFGKFYHLGAIELSISPFEIGDTYGTRN
jgi:hypothetical protein